MCGIDERQEVEEGKKKERRKERKKERRKEKKKEAKKKKKGTRNSTGQSRAFVASRLFLHFSVAIASSRVFWDFAGMKPDPVHRYQLWASTKPLF